MKKKITDILPILILHLISMTALADTSFEVYSPNAISNEAVSNKDGSHKASSNKEREDRRNGDAPDIRDSGPVLGQLQPVTQINLMKGYHLLDSELSYSQWSGDLPLDSNHQFEELNSMKSQESTLSLRYAYGLARYTYLGINFGFLQKTEADYSRNQGPMDPEIFIGQHFPWENGNIRLSVYASPSLGKNTHSIQTSDTEQSIDGNAFRGGYKIKPAAAIYTRLGPVILGSEVAYTYYGVRVIEIETLDYQTTHSYQEITGGNVIGLKANLELPKWQRLGFEWEYNQVQSSHIDFNNISSTDTPLYTQNKIKTYARLKLNNTMSLIPEVIWTQAPPDGVLFTSNNQDILLIGFTYRAKFN